MTSTIIKTHHAIKYYHNRNKANDDFTTPIELAKYCISLVPLKTGQKVYDPFRGNGSFYDNYPDKVKRYYSEIKENSDFFDWHLKVDWIISNPPYSILDNIWDHTLEITQKGFAYLLAIHGLTTRRIEKAEKAGFGLTKIHLCKVFKWFGMSAFVVFEKGKPNIISYDRKVWR